jgi:hypothetical protein
MCTSPCGVYYYNFFAIFSCSEVRTLGSPDLSEGTTEANDLNSPPRTTYTSIKYLKVVLDVERKGVGALRSVADMLRKSTEDLIKSIAIY